MTEDEKKKKLEGFQNPAADEDITDDWTEEEILEAAKRIMKRLGIKGEISDGT